MSNLTSVTVTSGVPTAGTGTVSTIDNLVGTAGTGSANVLTVQGNASGTAVPVSVADGADVTLGAQADAASATTTISAKLRAIATALGVTALDLGSGTAGTRTLRFFRDTAQWIGGSGANGSAVQRVTMATDDTLVASLATKLDTLHSDAVPSVAHDAVATGANPLLVGGYASAAAPSDVSADGDAVRLWLLRNGAVAIALTAGGALIPGDATNGIKVNATNQDISASATFTPAASAHTAPACNGAAQQFMFSPAPPSGAVITITDAEFLINSATAEASAWRLYLYNITPPSALSDTTTFDVPSGDQASFLGYVDLGTAIDLGSTQWVEAHGLNKKIKLAGTTVFAYLVNLTTLTPANVAHIAKIYAVV